MKNFSFTRSVPFAAVFVVVVIFAAAGIRLLSPSQAAAPVDLTIPDTNYTIPAGAIFVSTTGVDTNAGTQAAPVKTFTKAKSLVPSGGTIVFRAGVYRDGTTSRISKPMTLQPYPHEQVWFDGMDVTSGWTTIGNSQWSLAWDTPDFCNNRYYEKPFRAQGATDGPCTYADQYGDTTNPMSADPQMVYLNGDYIHEVATQPEAVGTKFYYDQTARKIIIGFDPAGKTVEVTKRPTAMFAEGFGGPVTIRGLGFAHYATDNFPEAAGFGAVIINVPGAVLENNVFTEMAGGGLHMADPMNAVIRGNIFLANGSMGMSANGHTKAGLVDNLLVEKNVFDTNNTERFGIGCNYSCQAAGSKMAHMNGLTLQDNVFRGNIGQAHGWWCDLDCRTSKVVRNVFQNNGGAGVYYEVSSGGIIASNLITGNGGYGVKVGSATTKIYNNTIVNNKVGALIYDDDRTLGVGGWNDVGPDTASVDLKNNIFSKNTSTIVQSWRTNATAPNTGPNTFYSGYDYNSYFRSGTTLNVAEWRDGTTTLYNTLAVFRTAKDKENSGQDITSGTDPFFVNEAGGDYHVRTSSVAYNSGTTLPADVAAAIGVAASPVSRGAITWVGSASTTPPPPPPPPPGTGDTNGDGRVNALDLSALISHDGQNWPPADFNADGTVGAADMAILLPKWTW